MQKLSNDTGNGTNRLTNVQTQPGSASYLLRCNQLIEDVKVYMRYIKDTLFPYIEEQTKKEKVMPDEPTLKVVRKTHEAIKNTLSEIKAVLPEADKHIAKDELDVWRNEMLRMQRTLTEIYKLEEEVLAKAQKS